MPDKRLLQFTRRRLLTAGAAASSLFLPVPYAWVWAQTDDGLKLLRSPKLALVIGNSKYRHSPLANPANDARGMAAALQEVGFSVTSGLELTQAAMREAIQAFSDNLTKSKAVGLFYFAGHGAQLAWRNYLLPVDAEIGDVQELRERAVDLNSLIDGIRKAGNPMNVIVLDACRDNPFGSTTRVDQKGLSQLDAPPGTFLAYATSPGNTAIDGDGSVNGLYTEHLLREIRVTEAKVEDVFKRVRLGVRRRSRGQQIPWESTSLEQDFYFLPPMEIKKLSEEQEKREFEAELAIWEKIKEATEPGPLEDYLLRYPSGRYSELAHFRLERVLSRQGEKAIEIVSSAGNPFTKGTMRADTKFRVGDWYRYRRIDRFTGIETFLGGRSVVEVTDNQVRFGNGNLRDLLGNPIQTPFGVFEGQQIYPPEYSVGKRWVTSYRVTTPTGHVGHGRAEFRVVARETIKVPAGSFDAFRIEGEGHNNWSHGWPTLQVYRRWVAPEVRLQVAYELYSRYVSGRKVTFNYRDELISYNQS
jgi:hypothetical protein